MGLRHYWPCMQADLVWILAPYMVPGTPPAVISECRDRKNSNQMMHVCLCVQLPGHHPLQLCSLHPLQLFSFFLHNWVLPLFSLLFIPPHPTPLPQTTSSNTLNSCFFWDRVMGLPWWKRGCRKKRIMNPRGHWPCQGLCFGHRVLRFSFWVFFLIVVNMPNEYPLIYIPLVNILINFTKVYSLSRHFPP